jgi:hypothetical protein
MCICTYKYKEKNKECFFAYSVLKFMEGSRFKSEGSKMGSESRREIYMSFVSL